MRRGNHIQKSGAGKYISIGSIEPQFYALLLEKTAVEATLSKEIDSEKVGLAGSPVGTVSRHIDGQFVHFSRVISCSSIR
jgi:hypothetical protein